MKVFEYGAGSSTLFFSTSCHSVVSVEHSAEWVAILREHLADRSNVDLRLAEAEPIKDPLPYSSTSFTSTFGGDLYYGKSFEKYVRTIEQFPDRHFDLVLVDGRARTSCIRTALPKIVAGDYLLLDNSERPDYLEGKEFLRNFPVTEIRGVAPRVNRHSGFSAWRIDNCTSRN
jgi:hypothetical protein